MRACIQARRPAPLFAVRLDRDLLDRPQDGLPLRPRTFVFESLLYILGLNRKRTADAILFLLVPQGRSGIRMGAARIGNVSHVPDYRV